MGWGTPSASAPFRAQAAPPGRGPGVRAAGGGGPPRAVGETGAAAGKRRGGPAGAGGAGRGAVGLLGPARRCWRSGAARPRRAQSPVPVRISPRRWLPWVSPPAEGRRPRRVERGGPAAAGKAAR